MEFAPLVRAAPGSRTHLPALDDAHPVAHVALSADDLAARQEAPIVWIRHANMFKHHNYPQRYEVVIGADGAVSLRSLGPRRASARAGAATP